MHTNIKNWCEKILIKKTTDKKKDHKEEKKVYNVGRVCNIPKSICNKD
jgi:hypothetical protein